MPAGDEAPDLRMLRRSNPKRRHRHGTNLISFDKWPHKFGDNRGGLVPHRVRFVSSEKSTAVPDRRPIASRSTRWAQVLTSVLVRAGVAPNTISVLSMFFAAGGALLLTRVPTVSGLIGTAACIQLRLVCNLLDGMVAIEGHRRSPTGALYNEVPDRIADSLLIASLGYSVSAPWLGWFGALAAALTAYIRVLGGSLGLPQDFRGPMAKPHRMAVLTCGCIVGAVERYYFGSHWALLAAAWTIALGATATCALRLLSIGRRLRST